MGMFILRVEEQLKEGYNNCKLFTFFATCYIFTSKI